MSAQVALQSGFILHQRPYRESSLLLDVFTRDHGVIPVLARGVRKSKSKLAGVLQPFFMLQISYLDKNDLKLLTHAELQQAYALQRLALYCGFYVNELVQNCCTNTIRIQNYLHVTQIVYAVYPPVPQLKPHYAILSWICWNTAVMVLI